VLEHTTSNKVKGKPNLEGKHDTEYRFSHWLLPTGEDPEGNNLTWQVTAAGRATAVYVTYYYLTIDSKYGIFEGEKWYEAGKTASWYPKVYSPIFTTDLHRFLGIPLKPDIPEGSILMNGPQVVRINWEFDVYGLIGTLFWMIIIGLAVAYITNKLSRRTG